MIGPDGRVVSKPLEPASEGLVISDIDTSAALIARGFLDICGHYSRPDLLWLGCDTREKKHKIDKPSGTAEEKVAGEE